MQAVVDQAPAAVPQARVLAEEAAERGHGAEAIGLLRGLVGAAPDDREAWSHLVAWSARWPGQGGLDAEARAAVIARHPGPELAGGRAWHLLSLGQPDDAAAALAAAPDTDQAVATARLRLALDRADDVAAAAAAERVLGRWPADLEACEAGARSALRRGDARAVVEGVEDCRDAGLEHPPLGRLAADALDLAGQEAAACAAWLDAGATLHAAAVRVGGGDCPGAPAGTALDELLHDPAPEAMLLATWEAVRSHDADACTRAVARLQDAGLLETPPFRLASAAALLVAGQPATGLAAIEGLDSARALVLRGRLFEAAGDLDAAERAFDAAVDVAGDSSPDVHRARLAFMADHRLDRVGAAADQLMAADPLALAFGGLEPDRLAPWPLIAPAPWPRHELSRFPQSLSASLDDFDGSAAAVLAVGIVSSGVGPVRSAWDAGDEGRAFLAERAARREPGAMAALWAFDARGSAAADASNSP
ncbi:MAG: hypothetical protein H6742_07225 [Alphaproteobacteria bacterium]|nr:hypothetical protein [Alphaproteobacteria bacterium]